MTGHLIAVGVGAAASALITWQLLSSQYDSALSKERLAYQESVSKALQQAAAETQRLQEQKDEAVKQAAARQARLARDVSAARIELDRLRDTTAGVADRAQDSCPAAAVDTSALAWVLGQCSGELADMAAKADGHANDVRTLIDAWPK